MTAALLNRVTHCRYMLETGNDRFRFKVSSAGAAHGKNVNTLCKGTAVRKLSFDQLCK